MRTKQPTHQPILDLALAEFTMLIRKGVKIPPKDLSDALIETLLNALDSDKAGTVCAHEVSEFLAEDLSGKPKPAKPATSRTEAHCHQKRSLPAMLPLSQFSNHSCNGLLMS